MASRRLTFILLLQLFSPLIANDSTEKQSEAYGPQIESLVNHLNRDINRVYDYKFGSLINAQNKV